MLSVTSKASLEPPFRSEMSTPEPSLFRHRNLSSAGRPSTAASNDSTYFDHLKGTQRPKREPRRPPVSFRKLSSTASLSHSYQASSIDDRASEIGSSLGTPRGRSDSITSIGSGRFKDLLDAQEKIRPIDFRARLEATGARDYGEDVADRNMRQNAPGNHDTVRHAVFRGHEASGPALPSRSGQLDPSATDCRTQSLTSSSHLSPHNSSPMTNSRLGSPIPDSASIKESRIKRNVVRPNTKRLSLHTYTPSGLTSLNTTHFTPMHDGARSPVWPSWGLDNTSRPHCVSPAGSNFSVPRSPKNSGGLRLASEGPRPNLTNHDVNFSDEERVEELTTPIASDRQPSLGSRIPHFSLPKAATPRLSDQNYRYSFASSITSRHTSGDYTALDYPRMLNSDIHDFSDNDGGDDQERSLRKPFKLRN